MTANDRSRNQRKRRAILASGLVLGVGAVITLAAWNDSVWGDSMFGTGSNSWNVQGTTDGGTTWQEFETQADAGHMSFSLGHLDLTPGESTHALFGLHETDGNLGATVVVAPPVVDTANTLGQKLNVRIVSLGDTDPGSYDGTGGTEIANYTMTTGSASAPVTIAPRGEQWLGFTVTLPAGTSPNGLAQEVGAAWEMQATSVEP